MTSLRHLWRERRRLLQRLTREKELALGTVSTVYAKCGKPNCRCAQGKGHPQVQFLFYGPDGRRRCKRIRQKDAERWLQAGMWAIPKIAPKPIFGTMLKSGKGQTTALSFRY
jgi:hypothetical protein